MEVATGKLEVATKEEGAIEEVHTPNHKTIEEVASFLGVTTEQTLKACVSQVEGKKEPLIVFIRGDLQVNESKLQKVVKAGITPLTEYEGVDLCFGFMGPYQFDAKGATVLFDESLKNEKNLVVGANKVDYHIKGISLSRDVKVEEYVDVAEVKEGQTCPCCGGKLTFRRGVEVGNIFQLGTKYSESMGMTYIDNDGKAKTPIMGCYGIGVGRLLACIMEAKHDDYGPIWPMAVAPWQVHICVLKSKKQDMNAIGFEIYDQLKGKYEVIMDDRNVGAGVQFADADLLGIPVRIVVGEKNLAEGKVELVTRDKRVKKLVLLEDVQKEVAELVASML
jgi:prolyl-tRNA synthetase